VWGQSAKLARRRARVHARVRTAYSDSVEFFETHARSVVCNYLKEDGGHRSGVAGSTHLMLGSRSWEQHVEISRARARVTQWIFAKFVPCLLCRTTSSRTLNDWVSDPRVTTGNCTWKFHAAESKLGTAR
jgi:hypothetical protein